ncbi:hypothetical protein KVV02_000931, partial [Mortierella alpina]
TAGECPDYPSFAPKDLPIDLYTNLNFAFAMLNADGMIAMQDESDVAIYKEINALKLRKPTLRTAVTVGGWAMDMAHYSKMVATPESRQKFIKGAIAFIRQHGFDGLDFDWEYPSDPKRGGHPDDPQNFVTFMKEMREAANAEQLKDKQERLILSIALPGGPFHGKYFLVPKLAPYVNWFNIMAYNLHGQWEAQVFCAAPLADPAKNTPYYGYSLIDAITSMAPKTVNPKKFNLGLSLSGVTFTLQDSHKTTPGSPAIGPGPKGCQEKGAMAYFESRKLANNLKITDFKQRATDIFHREVTTAPRMDEISKCMYMVVNGNQWVGFDTPETFAYKVDYLKNYGFGGVSIWSMDSDTANHELTNSIHSSLTKGFIQDASNDDLSTPKVAPAAGAKKTVDGKAGTGSEGKDAATPDKAGGSSPSSAHARFANDIVSMMALVIIGAILVA